MALILHHLVIDLPIGESFPALMALPAEFQLSGRRFGKICLEEKKYMNKSIRMIRSS